MKLDPSDLDRGERARLLAVRRLYDIHEADDWTTVSASALAAVIVGQSAPRRRLAPLLNASVHLALLTAFFISEGWGGLTEVEEGLDGMTDALSGDSRSELREMLVGLAAEIQPLADRFAARVASPRSSWSDAPIYVHRLQEAATDAAAAAAVLLAR